MFLFSFEISAVHVMPKLVLSPIHRPESKLIPKAVKGARKHLVLRGFVPQKQHESRVK